MQLLIELRNKGQIQDSDVYKHDDDLQSEQCIEYLRNSYGNIAEKLIICNIKNVSWN